MNGWVTYMGRSWDENFWTTQGYDKMSIGNGETVRVWDYSSTAYIRLGWSYLEPSEGNYFWNDHNSKLYKKLQSCWDRGMRVAFRIVIDGRDQGQNTPLYVKEAGAEGYMGNGYWSPYPDDPVFQEKFEKFLTAFASEFNDPDKVDFVDGYGLGKWGECHTLIYSTGDSSPKTAVFEWITNLYSRLFTKVPLVLNYHRSLGHTDSFSQVRSVRDESKALVQSAVNKGYCLRQDAFGMTEYYADWEKNMCKLFNTTVPIIMEGGWVTNSMRYWLLDPSKAYREGHPEDVRQGEYDQSKEAKVNMMDFRVNEVQSWFESKFDLVKEFATEGGYRLYPSSITYPENITCEEGFTVSSTWNNMGWGMCPTSLPQWNQKYKVGYALIDNNGDVISIAVAQKTDLSTWRKDQPTHYTSSIEFGFVPEGNYTLATGLVDITKENAIGLQMAVDETAEIDGWLRLGTVHVSEPETGLITISEKASDGNICYSTYYNSKAWIVPEGLTVGIITALSDSKVSISYKYHVGDVVPQATGVIVKGAAGEYFPMLLSQSSTQPEQGNLLNGSDVAQTPTSANKSFYKLSLNKNSDAGSIGFYWGTDDAGAFKNEAYKAYLAVDKASVGAKRILLMTTSTGIKDIKDRKMGDVQSQYNISGQKIGDVYHGIIIKNGKKYLSK